MKKQKNIYQLSRERAGLTRKEASERMGFLSESRIEKIEASKTQIHPAEVLAMEEAYQDCLLVNRYCTRECSIGRKRVSVLQIRPIEAIVLETLALSNRLQDSQKSLIDLAQTLPAHPENLEELSRMADLLEALGRCGSEMKLFLRKEEKKHEEKQ